MCADPHHTYIWNCKCCNHVFRRCKFLFRFFNHVFICCNHVFRCCNPVLRYSNPVLRCCSPVLRCRNIVYVESLQSRAMPDVLCTRLWNHEKPERADVRDKSDKSEQISLNDLISMETKCPKLH